MCCIRLGLKEAGENKLRIHWDCPYMILMFAYKHTVTGYCHARHLTHCLVTLGNYRATKKLGQHEPNRNIKRNRCVRYYYSTYSRCLFTFLSSVWWAMHHTSLLFSAVEVMSSTIGSSPSPSSPPSPSPGTCEIDQWKNKPKTCSVRYGKCGWLGILYISKNCGCEEECTDILGTYWLEWLTFQLGK